MAIRKDIDDMLNTLSSDTQPKSAPKKLPPINHSANELSADDIVTTLKSQSESREKPRKKRIIITGELPDYEALRAQEAERERLELERQAAQRDAEERAKRERIAAEREAAEQEEKARQARIKAEQERLEAERIAAEKAERERIAAEKEAAEKEEKARQARIKAEQERLEAERKAAEKAEKARIAAEKKAEAERAKAERAAEKKRLKEQREAERAKRAEERRAAEEAERARIAEEKRAAEEAEKARIEAEKAERERIAAEKAANALLNASDNFSIEEINDEPEYSDNSGNKTENDEPKEISGGFIEFFKHILNEDPDEIINQRNDSPEEDDNEPHKESFKKLIYAFFGGVFAVFACVGLITVIAKGIDLIGNFKSNDSNRKSFEEFLYPAVVMDIESFESPAELTSEQILTAAIWSIIMTDGVTEQYELTFDVVMIPAADVEAYAVKLFGSELPELVHATVGPAESRFYYNEETKSYNVPVAPVTYTYSPEVRGATRSGDDYILVVDYIDELPAWLPKTSSKSVEFVITSTDDGYHLKSMKILSTSTNAV